MEKNNVKDIDLNYNKEIDPNIIQEEESPATNTNSSSGNDYNMHNKTLITLIRDITMHYVKHFYDKYLKENNINKIPENELRDLINNLYHENQDKLRKYIRKTLKAHLKENYRSMVIENILCKMFEDPKYSKERLSLEIMNFQNNLNSEFSK
tara:strand:+ start:798 stop:1253 length:456 start_codon:yes stop_codon:yes gene_type:complete